MRIRVQLDPQIARYSLFQDVQKFWWQPSSSKQSIGTLLIEVAEHVGATAEEAAQLSAELDGFQVLHSSSISLLREGDLLLLKPAPHKRPNSPALHPAKRAKLQQKKVATEMRPEVSSGDKQTSSDEASQETSSSEESSEEASSSEEDPGSSEEEEAADTKSERFYTPAAKLTVPGSSKGKLGEDKAGNEPPSTDRPRPSRSARRKAAKRRLRREGILPPSTSKQQQQQRLEGRDVRKVQSAPATAAMAATLQPDNEQQAAAGKMNMKKLATHAGKARAVRSGAQQRGPAHGKIYFKDGSSEEGSSDDDESDEDKLQQQHGEQKACQQQQQRQEAKVHDRQAAAENAGRLLKTLPEERHQVPEDAATTKHLEARRDKGGRGTLDGKGQAVQLFVAVPSEEELSRLEVVDYAPATDSVLAYKLLEMGPNFAPQVSEVRLGRVCAIGEEDSSITLEPYPDKATHPLTWQRAAVRAARAARAEAYGVDGDDDDDEEEDEEDPGAYEEDGTLCTQLSSFVELRMLRGGRAAPLPRPAQHAQQGASLPGAAGGESLGALPEQGGPEGAQEGGSGVEELGPSRYSQLGPPRNTQAAGGPAPSSATMGGAIIPPLGGWASLHEQLQKRRAELAQQQQCAAAGAATSSPAGTEVPLRQGATGNGVQPSALPLHGVSPSAGSGGATRAKGRSGAATQGGVEEGRRSVTKGGRGQGGGGPGSSGSMRLQGAGTKVQGLTPGVTKPRGGVRASAMGPLLRMLRGANELK